MELALGKAMMAALEIEFGGSTIVCHETGKEAKIVKTNGPYISPGVVVYYVDLDDGITYTITIDAS